MSKYNERKGMDPTAPPKMTSWVNEPTVMDLKGDLETALSAHHAHASDVVTWLDNLNMTGGALVKKVKGKSIMQPKLIRKQAEWRYAALSEPFLSTDDVFNVDPMTFEDIEGAEQNALVLNHQFNTQMNKVRLIDETVRTNCDEGTVFARIGWEFTQRMKEVTTPVYEFHPPEAQSQVQELQAAVALANKDLLEYKAVVPAEIQRAVELSSEQGRLVYPVHVDDTIEEEMVTIHNRPTVDICNYNNVIPDPSCEGDLDKARFIVYSFETSRSELQREGKKYKNLDKLVFDEGTPNSSAEHIAQDQSGFDFKDEPRKRVIAYEYWGDWDIHKDGTTVPIVATWVGNTLIQLELNPFPDQKIPFVSAQYLPVRKSLYGEPDGALLEDNQKIVGAVTRGMIDSLARSANAQTGIRKDALDITNRRKFDAGKDYEYNASLINPEQGIHQHKFPEIPQSAQLMINLQNNEAESLTGVKAFSGGISGDTLGATTGNARSALDAASKRELGILRRLSEFYTQIGRKVISMNAEFLSEEEVVRVTNDKFVTVRRDDLAGNYDLKLTISTAEADEQKAKELAFMLQTMGSNMDPKMSRTILADIAKLRKMPGLARKLEEYEPKPDPMAQQKAMLELQLLQAQIEKEKSLTAENYATAQLNAQKAGTEGTKAASLQANTDKTNLDYIEQESGVTQERELQKTGEQAKANARYKIVEAMIDSAANKGSNK